MIRPRGATEPAILTLEVPPEGTTEARVAARAALADLPTEIQDRAELLVGELVKNALAYAPGAVVLTLRRGQNRLRIEVADTDRRRTELDIPDVTVWSHRGRGLALVAASSSDWGVRPLRGGKVVWCDLSL